MNSTERLQVYLDKTGILGWTAPREDVQEVLNELRYTKEMLEQANKALFLQELLIRINKARYVRDQ